MAVVYACLVVRSYFLAECDSDLAYASVMQSRASLCEILAMKLLNRFASNHIVLVAVLMTRWNPLAGATYDIVDQVKISLGQAGDSDMDSPDSALEARKPVLFLGMYHQHSSRWQFQHKPRHFLPHLSLRRS
jgi:hypothetical protein